jgi:hypothetical protein
MKVSHLVLGVAALGAVTIWGASSANAASILWANSAGSDLSEFDAAGNQLHQFFPSEGNGRGVVQVGNVLYTTVANSNNVYTKNATTGATTGTAFSIAGSSGLQAIAYDGTNFWVGDYSGTNKAYLYTPTGTLLKTVTLINSTGFYDGLEYFNGKLIANQFDGGFTGPQHYSVYDTDGNLLTANFIDTTGHGNGTGIAFDGTDFFVSDIFNNDISVWDGVTGAFIRSITLQGSHSSIEDLSVDYAGRGDTCGGPGQPPCDNGGGGTVPEPMSIGLLGAGLAALGIARRKRGRHSVG